MKPAPLAGGRSTRPRGFTLVEVLVALLMMSLLAGLAWRALDGLLRARDDSQGLVDRSSRLATVMAQWEQDLLALHDTEVVPPLSFDGQTLRLTRRGEGGVLLVAWSVRGGQWQRWAGPALVRSGDLQEAWLRSQQLTGSEPGTVRLVDGASAQQIYFARGGQWSNAQSTGDLELRPGQPLAAGGAAPAASAASAAGGDGVLAAAAAAVAGAASGAAAAQVLRAALPEAVRLQVTLDGKVLTRDIALGPAGS